MGETQGPADPDGDSAFAQMRAEVERLRTALAERTRALDEANERLDSGGNQPGGTPDPQTPNRRMEAIGQLAGGFAHDFNNLLTGVLGNLDLALHKGVSPDARRLIGNAIQAAERGARLTSHLLAFGRMQKLTVDRCDLNALISGLSDVLGRTLTSAVKVDRRLAGGLRPALADAAKLELALVNLAINARDAMPHGGTLTIETRNLASGADTRSPELANDHGAYVELTVRDTGIGMSAEIRGRAIEPFFTTKEGGQGAGLGLSMVHGLAKQLGGAIHIDSEPGQGTSVSLYLPCVPGAAQQPEEGVTVVSAPDSAPARAGTILLVDDDALVRDTVALTLRRLGYQVAEADGADAALAVLDRGDSIDVLVSDIIMPGIHGPALADEARKRRPELPVLLITGYPGSSPEAELAEQIYAVLRKPFRPTELDAMVQSCRTQASH